MGSLRLLRHTSSCYTLDETIKKQPYEVLVPRSFLKPAKKDSLLPLKNSLRPDWAECFCFAYPEHDRILIVRSQDTLVGSKTTKFLLASSFTVATDTTKIYGRNNVLCLKGLINEAAPNIFGVDLILSFTSKDERLRFIKAYEGKLNFVDYVSEHNLLSNSRKRMKKPISHWKMLGAFLAKQEKESFSNRLAWKHLKREVSKLRMNDPQNHNSHDEDDDDSEIGFTRFCGNVEKRTSEESIQPPLLLSQDSQASLEFDDFMEDDLEINENYIGPYFVKALRAPLENTKYSPLKNTISYLNSKPWVQCVLFAFKQSNVIVLYHSTSDKRNCTFSNEETGFIWRFQIVDEIFDIESVETMQKKENILRLKNLVCAGESMRTFRELNLSFDTFEERDALVKEFPILNENFQKDPEDEHELKARVALFCASLEEENVIMDKFDDYLRAVAREIQTQPQTSRSFVPGLKYNKDGNEDMESESIVGQHKEDHPQKVQKNESEDSVQNSVLQTLKKNANFHKLEEMASSFGSALYSLFATQEDLQEEEGGDSILKSEGIEKKEEIVHKPEDEDSIEESLKKAKKFAEKALEAAQEVENETSWFEERYDTDSASDSESIVGMEL